jgi:hypothetical protein
MPTLSVCIWPYFAAAIIRWSLCYLLISYHSKERILKCGPRIDHTPVRTTQGYDAIDLSPPGQVEGTGKEKAVVQRRLVTCCSGLQHIEPLFHLTSCSTAVFTTRHKQLHEPTLQSVHYRPWCYMLSFPNWWSCKVSVLEIAHRYSRYSHPV